MLQYKYEKQYTGVQKICKEFEIALQRFPSYISSKNFPCTKIEAEFSYRFVGNFITERLDYVYAETNISLDKSYYLGKCDYEIEIEYQDYKKAETILKLLAIEKTELYDMGKYNRFVKEFQRLENVNNEY